MKPSQTKHTILRLSEVRARTGLPRSTIYALQSKGEFPHSIKLSNHGSAVGWLESEIDDWIQSRIADRNSAA
ncbi:MAG: AlpA family transcriptional regulator [Marinobacter sp.]